MKKMFFFTYTKQKRCFSICVFLPIKYKLDILLLIWFSVLLSVWVAPRADSKYFVVTGWFTSAVTIENTSCACCCMKEVGVGCNFVFKDDAAVVLKKRLFVSCFRFIYIYISFRANVTREQQESIWNDMYQVWPAPGRGSSAQPCVGMCVSVHFPAKVRAAISSILH